MKLAGFDMGRNYVAWAVVRGSFTAGFSLYRHGLIYDQPIGDTLNFGGSLNAWRGFLDVFKALDLKPTACAAERFVYRPGSQGQSAEEINLRLSAMKDENTFLVRNTDWKSWFKRSVNKNGSLAHFRTPTEHEADAAGIALYLGSVVLPKAGRISTPT